jgi:hypothetical protein
VSLNPPPNRRGIDPHEAFKGVVIIDGMRLTKDSTIEASTEALKKRSFALGQEQLCAILKKKWYQITVSWDEKGRIYQVIFDAT